MSFSFKDLSSDVQASLEERGFKEPTPIQKEAIPLALEGCDIVGQAQTGTGKTAAFGIPIIEKLKNVKGVKALILVPTRELALQVSDELSSIAKKRRLGIYSIYGGVSIGKQISLLKSGRCNVLVGTPGRVKDLIDRGVLDLSGVRFVVLDEADQMLDMGFIKDIEYILKKTPVERQTMLFSATLPVEIKKLISRYLKSNYKTVRVGKSLITPKVNQKIIFVKSGDKLKALEKLLKENRKETTIVFVKTRKDAADLERSLQNKGIEARAIHGNLTQRQRENVMNAFRKGRVKVLVATDVAARGIDVKDVGMVINYELPENPEIYVHRIGRTGRAGREGTAVSLVSEREKSRMYKIKALSKVKKEKFKGYTISDLADEIKNAHIPEKYLSMASELLKSEIDEKKVVAFFLERIFS
ncbi:DEAD/DEAH box helicase [Desulfurobacterium atlanticum]|uniref:ATP-dependent RNA helicase DeaD n=1 Tax=Desulfurobacterium atlanticum TaxID=240169 RepID=A0A238ZIU0_9BACT|nr:DEAD/DEAH box helicase [Desulfurobacterium atlanticum]SNR82624.1 ATP-dependent RNA helicase DeaD [Desulfurobacterium atlanticum]